MVPALLTAAVVGLAGLFMQVAKLDQSVNTVAADIQELKNDSKERLSDIETRVRNLEMIIGRYKL
jgi:regulator of replication initiation timing